MARSVIVSAVRTPFGKVGGGLRDKEATELGAVAIRGALDRVDVGDDEVEYTIMGQVLQGGAGQAPARQAAIGEGRFADEIVPVGEFAVDESPRRDTTLERLSALKPVFDPEGTTTAGNAPGVNDGAGALVVTSEEYAEKRGLEILATIVAQGYVADEFAYLARTPAGAGNKALEKAGKKIGDVKR